MVFHYTRQKRNRGERQREEYDWEEKYESRKFPYEKEIQTDP
jgi:hypothetical protein